MCSFSFSFLVVIFAICGNVVGLCIRVMPMLKLINMPPNIWYSKKMLWGLHTSYLEESSAVSRSDQLLCMFVLFQPNEQDDICIWMYFYLNKCFFASYTRHYIVHNTHTFKKNNNLNRLIAFLVPLGNKMSSMLPVFAIVYFGVRFR